MQSASSNMGQHEMLTPRHDMEPVDEEAAAEDMGGNMPVPVAGEDNIAPEDQEDEIDNPDAAAAATHNEAEGAD